MCMFLYPPNSVFLFSVCGWRKPAVQRVCKVPEQFKETKRKNRSKIDHSVNKQSCTWWKALHPPYALTGRAGYVSAQIWNGLVWTRVTWGKKSCNLDLLLGKRVNIIKIFAKTVWESGDIRHYHKRDQHLLIVHWQLLHSKNLPPI